ncbi:ring finger domain-containing protein [Ditylenchus destructor]|nr:ring finger domain-containing protein [Ditylenchus destructor]
MSNYECTICTEDLCREPTCRLPSCGHVFHVDCMQEWAKARSKCPICSVEVTHGGIKSLCVNEDALHDVEPDETIHEEKCNNPEGQTVNRSSEVETNQGLEKCTDSEMEPPYESLINENQALKQNLERCRETLKIMEEVLSKSRCNAALAQQLKMKLRRATRRNELLKRASDLKYEKLAEKSRTYLAENDLLRRHLDEYGETRSALEKSKCALVEENSTLQIQSECQQRTDAKANNKSPDQFSKLLINELRQQLRKTLSEKQELEKVNANLVAELQTKKDSS